MAGTEKQRGRMADQVGKVGPGPLSLLDMLKSLDFILSVTGTTGVKLYALIYLNTDFCVKNRLLGNKRGSSMTNQEATVVI